MEKKKEKSETETTAGVLEKRSKTHKGFKTEHLLIRQNKTKCTFCLVLNVLLSYHI